MMKMGGMLATAYEGRIRLSSGFPLIPFGLWQCVEKM